MTRERFRELVAEALDSLPKEFRRKIKNVAVLVEDYPEDQELSAQSPNPHSLPRKLLLGLFVGTPMTQKSFFDIPRGPDHVILYQKNIEAVCRNDDEIRQQVRQTVIHELGHYFGLSEDELRDV